MNPTIQPSTNPSAVLYGRVSTDKQDVATQEIRGKEYLAGRKLSLVAEFYDDDTSGSIPLWDRPSGARLRALLSSSQSPALRSASGEGGSPIRHLVVVKLDRLGRSASDILATVKFLDSLGVTLHIVDFAGDALSTQGAVGRLMITLLAGFAEFERDLIRDRIQNHLDVKRDKGEVIGTVPYGWDAVETGQLTPKGVKLRRLHDNQHEQFWINHMAILRSHGWGYHSIANDLNARGVPTKRGKGEIMNLRISNPVGTESSRSPSKSTRRFTTGRWQAGNVAKILNNKTVQAWLASKPSEDGRAAA